MTTISAQAILVSRNLADPDPDRKLATVLCRYPRFIHAEEQTHRVQYQGGKWEVVEHIVGVMECKELTRNASSSRAIPVEKMIQSILDDTAMPIFWGKNQKGMQATEQCNELVRLWDGPTVTRENAWLDMRDKAIRMARAYADAGYHKQVVNRLLEPFMHITTLISATEWSNFYALRIHEAAEPHIRMLAEAIKKAIDEAPVQDLQPGQWHLPFVDMIEGKLLFRSSDALESENAIRLSTARCASTSYKTVEGFDMTLERATELHDKLVSSTPIHASPAEHVAQADSSWEGNGGTKWENYKQHRNFVGWRQYRAMLLGDTQ
jgi:hypothetical protein